MSASSSTTLAVPISYHKSSTSHLPPTPTSTSSLEKNKARELPSSFQQIPDAAAVSQKYGSLGSSTPYLESLSDSTRPVTPSTISPNDNDEGLYLLWTQQLLRERGFTPAPCRPEDDDNSSISDMSSDDEDDDVNIDYYIAHKSSPVPSTSAYSHRASMISRYSTTEVTTTLNTAHARQNPISTFFSSCFSFCF